MKNLKMKLKRMERNMSQTELAFVLCFAALTVSAARLKKKQKELEAEPEEE